MRSRTAEQPGSFAVRGYLWDGFVTVPELRNNSKANPAGYKSLKLAINDEHMTSFKEKF